jgi:hypothetical protein
VFLVAGPLITPAEEAYSHLVREFIAMRQLFGERIGDMLVTTAAAIHGRILAAVGMNKALALAFSAPEDLGEARRYFSFLADLAGYVSSNYVRGSVVQLYGIVLRVLMLLVWTAILLPFLIAAAYDGITQRNIKFAEFGSQSPTAFTLGAHALIVTAAVPLLYVVLPMFVSPWFMPAWCIVAMGLLRVTFTNMQPIFSR